MKKYSFFRAEVPVEQWAQPQETQYPLSGVSLPGLKTVSLSLKKRQLIQERRQTIEDRKENLRSTATPYCRKWFIYRTAGTR